MFVLYDVILCGGYVIDFVNGFDGFYDIVIDGGMIVVVGYDLGFVCEQVDVMGLYVLFGIIDMYVYLFLWLGGVEGYWMLVCVGVIMVFDVVGLVGLVMDLVV